MIKIKLIELDKHRNETTFRPFLKCQNELRDVGIEFVLDGNNYDFSFVGQASIINKKVSLKESIKEGLDFLKTINGDYFILDGQDSTSVIGTFDVFKESKAILMLKNSLLKNRDLYNRGWVNGRYYWGLGDYKPENYNLYSDRIVLSGTNWLGTMTPQWLSYDKNKFYDMAALFTYPTTVAGYEYTVCNSYHYDINRKLAMNIINNSKFKIAKLLNGQRLPEQEYYSMMYNSKIVFSPFGYGEVATRDIQAVSFGSIVLKPDMGHVDTIPNIYIPNETYIPCKLDFSDLDDKIHYILENYNQLQEKLTTNMRELYIKEYSDEKLALYLYQLFSSLPMIGKEN